MSSTLDLRLAESDVRREPAAGYQADPARREIAQLQVALRSSRTIGIAVGMVVERYEIGPEAAFAFLVRVSQHTNRKLCGIAAELVRTREVPTDAA